MKRFFTSGILLLITLTIYAQDARSLIKEGIQLSNTKDYTAAIEKFRSALAFEPGNISANYQMAYTLNAQGKGTEAIPYLQKVIAQNTADAITAASYALMGSIYDRTNQPQKAIESFNSALKMAPSDYLLHYNLGLTYFRTRQYA
ncbi:MAG: tetratricopeptide repeat protein, partial [Sphingobacteriales bacterium]